MTPDQQKAWRDGYAAGFKAAVLANHNKPDTKHEERRRILNILQSHADNESIQKVIDLINLDD
jgi:hypothetical protein